MGIDDLNDTQILVSVMPHLDLPSLLNLFEVSHRWNTLCLDLIPRQTRIEINPDNGHVRARRSPTVRLSWEVPRLAELRAPLCMRSDAESQLTVDLDSSRHCIPTEALVFKIAEVISKMHVERAQPLRILYLMCKRSSEDPLQELLSALSDPVRLSLHTLCVHYITSSGFQAQYLFPFGGHVSFAGLATLRLEKVGVDLQALSTALPLLSSLYLSCCLPVVAWDHLSSLRGLRHLCLIFGNHTRTTCTPALLAVSTLTSLTSMRLIGTPAVESCRALMPLMALQSLCLNVDLHLDDVVLFQKSFDNLAQVTPLLAHFDFSTNLPLGDITIPIAWGFLESLNVSYSTDVPYLYTLMRLILRRSAMYVRNLPLYPLPRNLVSLQTPYNALRSALGCDKLRELIWTQVTHQDFLDSQQEGLLMAVSQHGVWPLLDRVLVLRDPAGILAEHFYSGQLLDVLASRPHSIITHVTVQQDHPLTEILCRMLTLQSITLIDACVTLECLHSLLDIPSLVLLELIGIYGICSEDLHVLTLEGHLVGVKIHYQGDVEAVSVS